MEHAVLLTKQPNNGVIAQSLLFPTIFANGVDEEDALVQLRAALAEVQRHSRVVRIDTPVPAETETNPWLRRGRDLCRRSDVGPIPGRDRCPTAAARRAIA